MPLNTSPSSWVLISYTIFLQYFQVRGGITKCIWKNWCINICSDIYPSTSATLDICTNPHINGCFSCCFSGECSKSFWVSFIKPVLWLKNWQKNTSTFKVVLIEVVDAQNYINTVMEWKKLGTKIHTKALQTLSFKSDYMLIERGIWFIFPH